jgi:hypothetical protein
MSSSYDIIDEMHRSTGNRQSYFSNAITDTQFIDGHPPLAAELVDRLAILVAVRRFPGAADSRSLRSGCFVRMHHFVRRTTSIPFRRSCGDVRREFMQRVSAAFHGTLGSYLRFALQEGSADALACLPVPQA